MVQKIVFLGAGSAATGIADLMVKAFIAEGLTEGEAIWKPWFIEINDLLVKDSSELQYHNMPYEHVHQPMGFIEANKDLKPTILIDGSGGKGMFNKQLIALMSDI